MRRNARLVLKDCRHRICTETQCANANDQGDLKQIKNLALWIAVTFPTQHCHPKGTGTSIACKSDTVRCSLDFFSIFFNDILSILKSCLFCTYFNDLLLANEFWASQSSLTSDIWHLALPFPHCPAEARSSCGGEGGHSTAAAAPGRAAGAAGCAGRDRKSVV